MQEIMVVYFPTGELCLNPEMFNQLRNLQKKARELKSEVHGKIFH